MAPSVSGPKMRTMVQKAFWMHMKIFSTSMMNRMNLGSSVVFKAVYLEKASAKDVVEKAAAEAVAEENSSNHVARRKATIRKIMAKRIRLGKLKNPGGGRQTSLMMAGQQIHGSHGIRNQHMSK